MSGSTLVIVAGAPGEERAALARRLAAPSGRPVLSDVDVDRELHPYGTAGTTNSRVAVYAELARRVAAQPAAIVEASFEDPVLRRAFALAVGPLRWDAADVVECGPRTPA